MTRQGVVFVVARKSVERQLRPALEQRYEVCIAHTRREALQCVRRDAPRVVLVDAASVRFDVGRFFTALHELLEQVYTFLLLGKGMRLDQMPRTNGYLRHPVTPTQLLRRLSRLVPTAPQQIVSWQGLALDIENRFLIWEERDLPLTPKQVELAHYLIAHPETTVSRAELMKEVWGTDYLGDTRTLHVHIHWLRKALAELEAPFAILTERRRGYRLESRKGGS